MIVCDRDSKTCMIHRCDDCPGTQYLQNFLSETLTSADEEISFQQWQSTDSTKLISQTLDLESFIDLVVKTIDRLTSHSYLAKCQARCLKIRKEQIGEDTAIVLGDFAENYSFVVQDEVQSYHWSKPCCTLHPLVVYFKEDETLMQNSFCILSDDLEHDTSLVYQIQKELTQVIKTKLPKICKLEYFSDGCASQYKNYKNFLNLTLHQQDFGLSANWTFFASSHGKSPCYGIGGAVKRLTARANLQRPISQQILTAKDMFLFCSENINNISFIFITKQEMMSVREGLEDCFALGSTVPGTRSFHYIEPIGPYEIAYKRTSENDSFSGTHNFKGEIYKALTLKDVQENDFVACVYDDKWWIGMVEVINKEERDAKVIFFHPSGPAQTFVWPARADVCCIPENDFLVKIDAPVTATGRTYSIKHADLNNINKTFQKFFNIRNGILK